MLSMHASSVSTAMKERIKILFVYSTLPSFVREDLHVCKKHFNVKEMKVVTFLVPRKGRNPMVFLRLFKGVLLANIVYSWFADLNAFFIVLFCTLLRKKCVIVAGGYDVAYLPEIGYGSLMSPLGRIMVKFVLQHASKILAVSRSTMREALALTRSMDIRLVYNGVDVRKFQPSGTKENLAITVCTVSDSAIKKKGLEAFVKASKYLPNVQFALIGKYDHSITRLSEMADSNVEFTGYVSDEALLRYFQRATVYCQLSAHESFGVALAEAMSCCCVPVVTGRYAVSEVVGGTGFYVPYNDAESSADAIRKALKSHKGLKARERILKYFSLNAREKRLLKEIFDLHRGV